jgi:hypothetical protein
MPQGAASMQEIGSSDRWAGPERVRSAAFIAMPKVRLHGVA